MLYRIGRPGLESLHPKNGPHVFSLSGEDLVIIKVRLPFEMPFSNDGRLVSRLTHENGKGLSAGWNVPGQIEYSIVVWVLTGNDTGPAWRANGIHAKGVVKHHPSSRKSIELGGRIQRLQHRSVGSHRLGGVIIRHDEKNVGANRSLSLREGLRSHDGSSTHNPQAQPGKTKPHALQAKKSFGCGQPRKSGFKCRL